MLQMKYEILERCLLREQINLRKLLMGLFYYALLMKTLLVWLSKESSVEIFEIRFIFALEMDSMTKLNFFRKLDRLRGRERTREEIEQELIEPG